MNADSTRFVDVILEKVAQISQNKYLVALRDGMVITVPFTIIGSIFLIFNNLPFNGWNELIAPISGMLNPVVNVTFGLLSLIVLVGISYQMASLNKNDEVSGVAISVIAFILLMLSDKFEIDTSSFGSAGMFTAILTALIAGELLNFFIRKIGR